MKNLTYAIASLLCLLIAGYQASAQNPLITNQFTADPSAKVFEGKVYIYPSHDIPCKAGQGFIGFCMADYHVFSSENLTQWEDHGVILSQDKVDWVNPATYSMWAPDCIYKNGKYYFYFPAISKEKPGGRRIGVAIADSPKGPFIPQPDFIENMTGIDPCPFIDQDGKAYIYWGYRDKLFMAKLKDNLLELASEPEQVMGLSDKFMEGPYLFERNNIFYLTFPHKVDKTERLDYAMATHPMGPFKYMGTIMDESPVGCWTNHQSIVQYKDQWYLFYHHNDLSPEFDKNRSIRADSLFFNADGSIQKVTPTLRGVGLTAAASKIQIDRYSELSKEGATVSFLNTSNKQEGWETTLNAPGAWVRYNAVKFSNKKLKTVTVNAKSQAQAILEIRTSAVDGPVVAKVKLSNSADWNQVRSKIKMSPKGTQDLFFLLNKGKGMEIDWISFE